MATKEIVSKESLMNSLPKILKEFKKKIEFKNADVLNKLSVDKDNNLLYDGKQITVNGGTLKISIVTSLPVTDIDSNTIYLVSNGSSKENNIYTEYLYVNNKWEVIGSTDVDLTDYVKKTELDNKLKDYTKTTDVNNKLKDYETINNFNSEKESLKNLISNTGYQLKDYVKTEDLDKVLSTQTGSLIEYPINLIDDNVPNAFKTKGIKLSPYYGSKELTWKLFSTSKEQFSFSSFDRGYTVRIQLDRAIIVKKIVIEKSTLVINKINAINGDINSTTIAKTLFGDGSNLEDSRLEVDLKDNTTSSFTYEFSFTANRTNSGGTYYWFMNHIGFYVDNITNLGYVKKDEVKTLIGDATIGGMFEEYKNTSKYNVNDYVIYNNCLYKCNTKITDPEEFNKSKWTLLLGNEEKPISTKIVTQLPTENILENVIYLIPKSDDTSEDNNYLEYIYINNSWEQLGDKNATTVSIGLTEW